MSDNQVFDQNKLKEWVALCEEGGNLRRSGASAETLAEINIRINKALVALLPISQTNEEAENLFQIINGSANVTEVTEASDPADPTHPN